MFCLGTDNDNWESGARGRWEARKLGEQAHVFWLGLLHKMLRFSVIWFKRNIEKNIIKILWGLAINIEKQYKVKNILFYFILNKFLV